MKSLYEENLMVNKDGDKLSSLAYRFADEVLKEFHVELDYSPREISYIVNDSINMCCIAAVLRYQRKFREERKSIDNPVEN